MCLDFPGHVTSRDGDVATVDVDGRMRRASTLLMPDVRVGEWVYVAAGTIVDRLSADDARLITAELRRAKETQP
jgi:hydrogenase assembly chaperone HypC/HupF